MIRIVRIIPANIPTHNKKPSFTYKIKGANKREANPTLKPMELLRMTAPTSCITFLIDFIVKYLLTKWIE